MTSAPNWAEQVLAITATITLLVTMVGFVFIARQITLLKRAAQSDANGRLSEQSLSILGFIADHPHVYDYLYASKPLHSLDEHRVDVLCACEMIANYADLVVCTLSDIAPATRSRWTRFITDTSASSPAFKEFMTNHRLWYSDALLALL